MVGQPDRLEAVLALGWVGWLSKGRRFTIGKANGTTEMDWQRDLA